MAVDDNGHLGLELVRRRPGMDHVGHHPVERHREGHRRAAVLQGHLLHRSAHRRTDHPEPVVAQFLPALHRIVHLAEHQGGVGQHPP